MMIPLIDCNHLITYTHVLLSSSTSPAFFLGSGVMLLGLRSHQAESHQLHGVNRTQNSTRSTKRGWLRHSSLLQFPKQDTCHFLQPTTTPHMAKCFFIRLCCRPWFNNLHFNLRTHQGGWNSENIVLQDVDSKILLFTSVSHPLLPHK